MIVVLCVLFIYFNLAVAAVADVAVASEGLAREENRTDSIKMMSSELKILRCKQVIVL